MTTVILTESDAELFKQFCQNHNKFTLVQSKGGFDIKNGKTIIHYDWQGEILGIELDYYTFKVGR